MFRDTFWFVQGRTATVHIQSWVVFENLLVSRGSFVGCSCLRFARQRLLIHLECNDNFFKNVADDFIESRRTLSINFLQRFIDLRGSGEFLRRPQIDLLSRVIAPVLPVERRLKDGANAMVIMMRNRVVTVRMALSTTNRHPQHRGGYNFDRLRHHVIASNILIAYVSGPVRCCSQESGCR